MMTKYDMFNSIIDYILYLLIFQHFTKKFIKNKQKLCPFFVCFN